MKPVKRTIQITVPAGVEDGMQLRLGGEGEPSAQSGQRGDLFCVIRVAPHSLFSRRGNDIFFQMPISFSQAALGAKVEVPTLTGKAETLSIPAGIQNGDILSIRRVGIPNLRGGRKGDQLVQVVIETPKKLSSEQKKLLREFARTEEQHVTPMRRRFLECLKEYLS